MFVELIVVPPTLVVSPDSRTYPSSAAIDSNVVVVGALLFTNVKRTASAIITLGFAPAALITTWPPPAAK